MRPIRVGYPQILKLFLDILFPIPCAGCGKYGNGICDKCFSNIPRLQATENLKIIASVPYKSTIITNVITRYKFSGERHFAPRLAELILPVISDTLVEIAESAPLQELDWVICPVPTSKKRYSYRGFNPPELICKEIVKKLQLDGVCHENLLYRQRDDIKQSKTDSRAERFRNLSHAFRAKNASGKNIIVIDDVTTTGATLLEAERALKENGAGRVILFAIAH